VVAWRRMTGGITSAVHRLTIEGGARRRFLVLRQYEQAAGQDHSRLRREVDNLRGAHAQGLAVPEVVAFSPHGQEAGGHPSILMTRLRGQVQLTPGDAGSWLGQVAATAAAIHNAKVRAPAFEAWIEPDCLVPPSSAADPGLWQAAYTVLRQPGGSQATCFIHRDFQHFNFLWARGRLTGVVDWGEASTGPPGIDVGHCRLNLAVLFGPDWAERFRQAYEAETGWRVDAWWDLHALASYGDAWRQFIPIQVAGRALVDTDGMTARVEELLRTTLRRL
jgi:aminoglycoside phosphotransferase (APT) family kinase protein